MARDLVLWMRTLWMWTCVQCCEYTPCYDCMLTNLGAPAHAAAAALLEERVLAGRKCPGRENHKPVVRLRL